MKKIIIVLATLFSISIPVSGVEVGHGQWSNESQILMIRSYWSFTDFKIDGTDGCGSAGDGWWRLGMHSSNVTIDRALEYKKSMLLAAYMSGKKVQLRCENETISDFTIGD